MRQLAVFLFISSSIASLGQENKPIFPIYDKVDVQPSINSKAWRIHLMEKLSTENKKAVAKGLRVGQYTITVRFLVNTDSTVSEVKAVNDLGYGLSLSAEELVKHGPKWNPASINGKSVSAYHNQAITFFVTQDEIDEYTANRPIQTIAPKNKPLASEDKKANQTSTSLQEVKAKPSVKKVSSQADIRKLSDEDILSRLIGYEFTDKEGRPKYILRVFAKDTFQLWFSNDKPDDYSKELQTSLRNGYSYQRLVKGSYKIYRANIKQMGRGLFNQPVTNEFGETLPVFIYIKYYIVFTGTDESGQTYNMCTRLYQLFDHNKMDRWYLSFTNVVDGLDCRCSQGNGKNRDVWIQGFYL